METYERPQEPLTFEKVWFMFQETANRFQETDRKFQETDKQFKETDKKLNKLEHLFTSQWGKLVESLVAGDLIKLLNKKGIEVHYLNTRISGIYNKRQFEFDIIAQNDKETVVVEVKTTLKPDDIKDFIEDLKHLNK
jgi:predicted transcriptional regulator